MNARTALVLLALSGPLAASTVVRTTLEGATRDAHVIADVRIDEVRSHVLPNGILVTTHRATVLELLKGVGPPSAALEFTMIGGTLGDRTLRIPGLPPLRPGARHVLFLTRPSQLGTCAPIGLGQGVYEVAPVEDGGDPLVSRRLEGLTIVDPRTGRAVDVPPTRETLSAFKERVRAELRRTR